MVLTTVLAALIWAAIPASAAPSSSPGPAADISMTPLSPAAVSADGTSGATSTLRITDAQLNPIPGDRNIALTASDRHVRFAPLIDNGDGTYTLTVTSSTTAHQVMITATETASQISASQPLTQVHGPASRVALSLSRVRLPAGGIATTTATIVVGDAYGNPILGEAVTLRSSDPGMRIGPVIDMGDGAYVARVTSSTVPGRATLTATDISSASAPSASRTLTESPAPSLVTAATMQWTFYYTRAYTLIRALTIAGAPPAATVSVACAGGGCPFARWTVRAGKLPRCADQPHVACRAGGQLVLAPRLGRYRFPVGTRMTVRITRPGWVGKFYAFLVRPAAGPAIRISCLAPGGTQPGVACH